VAITRHGMLRARAWTSDLPEELPRPMSRRALVEFLGAADAESPIDLALVRPQLPADGLRAGDGHDASGHGDHHDGSPLARMAGLMRPEMPEVWSIIAFSAITGLLYLALPLAVNAFVSNLSFGATSGPFIQALLAIGGVLLICLTVGAALRAVQYVVVEAPRDGIVMSVSATEGTYLKPGTPICVVIPETEDRFVEVWVDGMDMPLITPRQQGPGGSVVRGSLARLQFEGWPAIQFVGWPSVAIGTFGGEVISIDAADDGRGRFRIIIAPEHLRGDEAWPGTQFLRQGVRANAWVLLRQVPLWFELWRQLNGFPPVVADKAPDAKKMNDEEE
jgi:hypothetical protein